MGKNWRHKQATISLGNQGCAWNVFHIIKYHHQRFVKKKLSNKRHEDDRCLLGVQNPDNGNTSGSEMDNFIVKEKMAISCPAPKTSVKARIKALFAEEADKTKGRHHRSSSYPEQRSQLLRCDSIHHLKPSEFDPFAAEVLDKGSPTIVHQNHEYSSATSTSDPMPLKSCEEAISDHKRCEEQYLEHNQFDEDQKQPIENNTELQEKLDDNTKQDELEQKLIRAKEDHSKEFLDALDIISINKDLVLKILQDPGSPLADHFCNQQTFSAKMGLTKSGTFPLSSFSYRRGSRPGILQKNGEGIVSDTMEKGKFPFDTRSHKSFAFSNSEDLCKQSIPSKAEHEINGIQKSTPKKGEFSEHSSPVSAHHLKNLGGNEVAVKRFKDLKQKIKHLIKENRKERHRITMDAILHKIPHGCGSFKELKNVNQLKGPIVDREGKDSPASSYEGDYSAPSFNKTRLRQMRRSSSFNESLDRYCQLYETSFNKEAAKHDTTEGSNFRTEEGRVLSLPDLQSYVDQTFDEQKSLDLPTDSENQLQSDASSKIQENLEGFDETNSVIVDGVGSKSIANNEALDKVGLIVDDLGNLTTGDMASCNEEDIKPATEPIAKLEEASPLYLPDYNFKVTASPEHISISEDTEVKAGVLLDGLENLAKQQHESGVDGKMAEKVEFLNNILDYETPHLHVDAKDKAEFDYVRDVLELSGFSVNESLGTWHSDEHPVDPSVYEEVEGCLFLDPDCSGNEEGGNCNHLLLFDLINEVLMEIYGRSYSYYPMKLSSLSHIRPMPTGHHVLKEVWSLISWYISSRLEVDQSLDDIVSRDLAKGEGWMNLQFDTECVGLEIEDLIFDDLLEEVLWT